MYKVLKKIIYIFLWVWQLPQNICGLLYKLILRGEKRILEQRNVIFYIAPTMSGGVSLGNYIFLSKVSGYVEAAYDHEFGHTIQSRILGPLYLPIVGLSSGLHCLFHNSKNNYYNFWTERWANKLGGIEGYSGGNHYHKDGVIVTSYKYIIEWFKNFNGK